MSRKRHYKGFAERFEHLRAGRSYGELSDQIYEATGIRITPQALHRWSRGASPTEQNAAAVAKFFGVSTQWLLHGITPRHDTPIDQIVSAPPDTERREVLEMLRFCVWRASQRHAAEEPSLAAYRVVLDEILAAYER